MEKIRLEDDFYLYQNKKWLDEAVIPNDKPLTGSFVEIMIDNEKTLMADLKEFALNGVPANIYNDKLFSRFIELYRKAINKEERDSENNKFIKSLTDKVLNVKTYDDLEKLTIEFIKLGLPSILSFGIQSDMKNASVNTLYFGSPSIILPDKGYYDESNPAYQSGLSLLEKYKETILKLFTAVKIENKETILNDTLAFDKLIVPLTKTSEQRSDYVKSYNPYTLEELSKKTELISIKKIIGKLIDKKVEEVIVTNTNFADNLDSVLKDNLELIKSWLITKLVYMLASSGYGTDDIRLMASSYSLLLTGQKEAVSFEKFTYNLLSNQFGDVVGIYFGKRYFGEKAKLEVETMVDEFIDVYKKRLSRITWLSKETVEKALIKLSKITAMIGYPTKINPIYEKFEFKKDASFIENMMAFSKEQVAYEFSQYKEAVDKDLWHMGAHVVNAYYEPMNNQIVFPAGILQKPFYSYTQSKGANYGGIGAVIAHEITHAFDTNGAKIDEFGNINNWWKQEDFDAFNKRAEKMVTLFDGLLIPGTNASCNGRLTVTENIADAAGLSSAYEAGMKHKEFKVEDFFSGWAHIWRFKANQSYLELLANIDVHAPAYLRGLVQLKNFKPFTEYYKLKETDGMFIKEEDQVSVW